jgi:SSS family solute:Na+ symporter
MFPHMFMHWLTARRAESFKLPLVAYPICIAVVWLPSVLLGLLGRLDFPDLAGPAANSVLVEMIRTYAPGFLAGLLAAGVFAAIMSSLDSQVLSLGTMFTQDVVRHYGFHDRMSERRQVLVGRLFVTGILLLTYLISLASSPAIFRFGIWSFTGFAALFPVVLAALFWERSTKQGVAVAVLGAALLWIYFFARGWAHPGYTIGDTGIMPVAVLLLVSGGLLVVVSWMTPPPSRSVRRKFFVEAS